MHKFAALADPTRRQILEILAREGELPATEISRRFQVSPQAISQHLKVLRAARLVLVEKRAQQRIYTVNPEVMYDIEKWAEGLRQLWNRRFDALDQLLLAEQRKETDDEP